MKEVRSMVVTVSRDIWARYARNILWQSIFQKLQIFYQRTWEDVLKSGCPWCGKDTAAFRTDGYFQCKDCGGNGDMFDYFVVAVEAFVLGTDFTEQMVEMLTQPVGPDPDPRQHRLF